MSSCGDSKGQGLSLLTEEDSDSMYHDDEKELRAHPHQQGRRKTRRFAEVIFIATPWLLVLMLTTMLLSLHRSGASTDSPFPQLTYSPAQSELEYEVRRFQLGLGADLTAYQGEPSPELDQRWDNLYEMGITLIDQAHAAKMINKTVIFPHDPLRRYVVELDVFHQLHCLNMIRKALRPDYYKPHIPGPDGEDELLGVHHIDHCVDQLRQSLMCTVDISPLTWKWDAGRAMILERAAVPHTCRNFEKIQAWARERSTTDPLDTAHPEKNDPLDPSTWTS